MKNQLTVILTLTLLVFTNSSLPAVIRVPSDYPTIKAATDAAWGSETLAADGTYTSTL